MWHPLFIFCVAQALAAATTFSNITTRQCKVVEMKNERKEQSNVWCCFHGFHYHECYESVKHDGCVIGSSIVWPRPQQWIPMQDARAGGRRNGLDPLRYPTMNGGFMICSDVPECAPTEAGGAFFRGVIKNCRECCDRRLQERK